MKLVEGRVIAQKAGTVKIIPEDPDDLWLAYTMISPDDVITTMTTRKIHQSSASSSGKSKNPVRVRVKLEIKVTSVDYAKDSAVVQVHGRTQNPNPHVAAGSFHTVELGKDKEFALTKKLWEKESINKLKTTNYDLGVVLIEETSANLYLIGKGITKLCASVVGLPDPATGSRSTFFRSTYSAFEKYIDLNILRCAVIGGPGVVKSEFRNYLMEESRKSKLKSVEKNKARIVLVETSSGKGKGLREVLNNKTIMNHIKETEIAVGMEAMKEFNLFVMKGCDRACYGLKSVEMADEFRAIETLMITDEMVRSGEASTRNKCVELVKSVKEGGGKAMVFPDMHVCCEELGKMTGIAAILRFPVPEIDNLEI